MNRFVNFFCLCTVGVVMLLVGCNSAEYPGPPRHPVSGNVSLNGTPIQTGNITFRADEDATRSASGAIENGKYSIEEKQGPTAGQYTVEILGFEEVGQLEDEDLGVATRQIVPVQFNESSSLSATISADDVNKLDFDLKP